MTNIIAILVLAGQFQVAVETSHGYFTKTYEDSEDGINQFFSEVSENLESDKGRFYPCIVTEQPDPLKSNLILKIGPGNGYSTAFMYKTAISGYMSKNSDVQQLDAKISEKICEANFLPNYKSNQTQLGAFYRKPKKAVLLNRIASCEAAYNFYAERAGKSIDTNAMLNLATLTVYADAELKQPRMNNVEYQALLESKFNQIKTNVANGEDVVTSLSAACPIDAAFFKKLLTHHSSGTPNGAP